MVLFLNVPLINTTLRCLERKTADSVGISVRLETPQGARFSLSEEAQATPLGKRAVWSAKQQFVYCIMTRLLDKD